MDEIALSQQQVRVVAAEDVQIWVINALPRVGAVLICNDQWGGEVYFRVVDLPPSPLPRIVLIFQDDCIYLWEELRK